jgi:DNA-binding transcriptional MocR family regulator
MKGKTRFVIAMPSQLENPTYADLKALLKNTGVNAVPLNLIGTDPEPINKIISIWSSSLPYYLLKQMMLLSYTTPVAPNNA